MNLLLMTLAPWIAFFALFHGSFISQLIATVAALITLAIANRKSILKKHTLTLGSLAFFIFYAANLLIFKNQWIIDNGYFVANIALAAIAWFTILIGKPFTLQYANETASEAQKSSPYFKPVSTVFAILWATIITLMIIPAMPIVAKHTHHFAMWNLGISALLIIIGIQLTQIAEKKIIAHHIKKLTNVNLKTIYQQQKQPFKDVSKTNTQDIEADRPLDADVIVVGAGPCGLLSALQLQQYGLDVIVYEKHPGTSMHPKARGISCRSMEYFRRLNLDKQIKQFTLPESQNWFGWFDKLNGKRFSKINIVNHDKDKSPCTSELISQTSLENILCDTFIKRGGEVYFNHKVTSLAQNDALAQLTIENLQTKETFIKQAQYIIGADGVNSSLRKQFDFPMFGPTSMNTNTSIYCKINLDGVMDKDQRSNISYLLNQDGPSPMFMNINNNDEWLFVFPSTHDDTDLLKQQFTEEYTIERILNCFEKNNQPKDINILSINHWTLGSQIANQFNTGRTFLVGDSIHQFSPTGALGLNTGLGDVDNLMWKIAYVIKGIAHKDILNTYYLERKDIILNNLNWSVENLRRIIDIQININDTKPNKLVGSKVFEGMTKHLNKSGLDLGFIYQSPIIALTDEAKPTMASDHYIPNTFPGTRFPHIMIEKDGATKSSLDMIDNQFVLFSLLNENDIDTSLFTNMPTKIITLANDGHIKQLFGDASCIWVRPDGHIAWKGQLNHSKDLAQLNEIIKHMR